MLQLPPRLSTVDSELNRQFQQAALNSSAESDPFFSNVSMRFNTPSPSSALQEADQVICHAQCSPKYCLDSHLW